MLRKNKLTLNLGLLKMNQFKKVAIAGAVSALMFSSVAQAHVSYNSGASKNGNPGALWTGGAPDYSGSLPTNWVANIHNDHMPEMSLQVSTAHAASEGAPVDYVIQSKNNKWNPDNSWGAALGYGLIDMHAAGNLTITVKADTDSGSIFTPGFSIFSGWDTGAGNKHQAWNLDASNPGLLDTTGLTYLGHSSTTTEGGMTTLTLANLAAGEYSVWIGGNAGGPTGMTNQRYIADIAVSAVPVPAAAWLMGSAVLGLAGMRRKKETA